MKEFNVTAAVIIYKGKVLCMQRDKSRYDYISYKYEFPGGKIEPGEAPEATIVREIKEELGMDIQVEVDNYLLSVDHQYPDFRVKMACYVCQVETDEFQMNDHVAYQWLLPEAMDQLDWVEADAPIVSYIQENTKTLLSVD